MRIFSFSEAYGPFRCEVDSAIEGQKCDEEAWICILTDEENNRLPEQSGAEAAKTILTGPLGKMICEDCFDKYYRGG